MYRFSINAGNALVGTALGDVPSRGSTSTPPAKMKLVETSLTKDHHEAPMDIPAADVSIGPEKDSRPSTVESHGRAECFRTPREPDSDSRRPRSRHQDESSGDHREPGKRRESWSTQRSASHLTGKGGQKSDDCIGLAGNKCDAKDGYHRRRSSDGGRSPQRSCNNRDEASHEERIHYNRREKLGRRSKASKDQRETNADIGDGGDAGIAGSSTRRRRSTADTGDEGDKCRPLRTHPPGKQRDLEVSGDVGIEAKEEAEERSELHPTRSASDANSDTTIELERGIGSSEGEGVVVQEEAHGNDLTKRSRVYSSDNENVETIELSAATRSNHAQDHAQDDEQQQAVGRGPTDNRKGSNQDEDREFDEDSEIDRDVPQLEIGAWGTPQPGQSVTSRLHRHISQSSTQAGNLQGVIPPPKEFLTQGSLNLVVSKQREVGRAIAKAGKKRDTEETSSTGASKPAANGRRRTAADLEWSDGGETPDVGLADHVHNQCWLRVYE